jgi:hypothetical protein
MIYEVKNYVNDKNMTIRELKAASTTGIDLGSKYVGSAVIPLGPGLQITFEFPFGYTLEKCFEEFEDFANKKAEETLKKLEEEERNRNLIVTPGQKQQPNPNQRGFSLV